jgi:hypothetical protein
VDAGLTVALRAAVSGRTYTEELEALSRRDEADVEAEVRRTKLALFAADTVPGRSWAEARALLLALPQHAFDAEMFAWHGRRLGVYTQRALVDFGRLTSRPSFCVFATELDRWLKGSNSCPPAWWVS